MKNNTKFAALIIIALLMLFTIQSCKKYPNNQQVNFSLRTERVGNTWKVGNYKKNDVDYTSLVRTYTEKYTKPGDYSYAWGIHSGTGTWTFQNNDTEIRIIGVNNQNSVTLHILKLEDKQFWYYYMEGKDKKEFHMIQQ